MKQRTVCTRLKPLWLQHYNQKRIASFAIRFFRRFPYGLAGDRSHVHFPDQRSANVLRPFGVILYPVNGNFVLFHRPYERLFGSCRRYAAGLVDGTAR